MPCAFAPTTSTLYLMLSASENKKKRRLNLVDSALRFKLVRLTKLVQTSTTETLISTRKADLNLYGLLNKYKLVLLT
jgi:hypothetical protein